jgi:F-type H+-transporting ATPase subunit delta
VIVHDPTVAERYARALFNVAKRDGVHTELLPDTEELLKLFAPGTGLRNFFEGPQISGDKKEQLLAKVLKGKIHKLLYQTIDLLLRKRRIEYVEPILDRFRIMTERDQGIYEAKVATAQPLGDSERQKLQSALEKYTTHRLKIKYAVDPSLIAGVRVTYGDTLIDDSVKGKLARLRQQLEEAVKVGR